MFGKKCKESHDSILKRVTIIGRVFSAVLCLMLLANIVLMLTFQIKHDTFITNVGKMEVQRPSIKDDIPNEMWNVIAGFKSIEECRAYDLIDEVSMTIRANGDEKELRTFYSALDNIRKYVDKIVENMKSGVPIVESENLLNTLRSVCDVADGQLDEYITNRIDKEGVNNRVEQVLFYICCIGEVAAWISVTRFNSRKSNELKGFIASNLEQLEVFAAKLAGGELDARAPVQTTTELVPLTESLNVMADRLNELIEQNKREQQNLKKSELRTLQAQINPHFLYNTLDAIMWQAEANNSEEVIRITRALSDFFRISLSAGEEWITVSQEVKHLEGYLSIQKVRYRDVMNYEIDIDPEIENVVMLKLLLQPLVENALYHGIKLKRGGGTISVTGRREGDDLVFCVADTGVGIPPDKLREIEEHMHCDNLPLAEGVSQSSGFGLRNVDLRIRLYYNQPIGLKIESDEHGSRFSFRVPVNAKGRDNV